MSLTFELKRGARDQEERELVKRMCERLVFNRAYELTREGCVVISDPEDKNFDLEAYLTMKMADEAK